MTRYGIWPQFDASCRPTCAPEVFKMLAQNLSSNSPEGHWFTCFWGPGKGLRAHKQPKPLVPEVFGSVPGPVLAAWEG